MSFKPTADLANMSPHFFPTQDVRQIIVVLSVCSADDKLVSKLYAHFNGSTALDKPEDFQRGQAATVTMVVGGLLMQQSNDVGYLGREFSITIRTAPEGCLQTTAIIKDVAQSLVSAGLMAEVPPLPISYDGDIHTFTLHFSESYVKAFNERQAAITKCKGTQS